MATSKWAFKPTLGAKVQYAGKEWTVWSQADVRDSWWIVRRDHADAPQEQARVTSRELAAAR
jgi:hypothetical protein